MNGFCGNGCGGFGNISPICLIILLLLFCGNGNGIGNGCGNGCGIFGDSSIFIILILFCCLGGNFGCGICENK